jgi:hypothetical protein
MQRLSDTWRSRMGSTAIAVVNSFFDSNEIFESDEGRKEFAESGLKTLSFLYEDTTSADQKVHYLYCNRISLTHFCPSTRNGKVFSMGHLFSKRSPLTFRRFLAHALSKPWGIHQQIITYLTWVLPWQQLRYVLVSKTVCSTCH